MRVARIHARGANCLKLILGKLGSGKAAAAVAKTLELLIFIRADEIAGDLAVARHGNRLTLRAHAVAAEVAGEFGSRDGFGRVHGDLSFSIPIYANYVKTAICA